MSEARKEERQLAAYRRGIEATARRAIRAQRAIERGDGHAAALIALGGPIRQPPIDRAAVEACRETDSRLDTMPGEA